MRRGNDNGFLVHEDVLVGISLGADFTAEHEWGIKGITQRFGLEGVREGTLLHRKCVGIDARRVKRLPKNFEIVKHGDFSYLFACQSSDGTGLTKKYLDQRMEASWTQWRDEEPITLCTAWDRNSFGVATQGKEGRTYLKELVAAFHDNDAAITFAGRVIPFGNPGLMLLIVSRLQQEWLDIMRDGDIDNINLKNASIATGIIDRLKEAGRKYFACSPRWANKEKTEVQYWLNPMEQNIHNSNWVSVADLDDWIEGKGKVMKEVE